MALMVPSVTAIEAVSALKRNIVAVVTPAVKLSETPVPTLVAAMVGETTGSVELFAPPKVRV